MPFLSPHAPTLVARHLPADVGPWRLVELVAGPRGPMLARVWGAREGIRAGDGLGSLVGVPRSRAAELFSNSVEVGGLYTAAAVHDGSVLALLQTPARVPDLDFGALSESLGESLMDQCPVTEHALVLVDGQCTSWTEAADVSLRQRWVRGLTPGCPPLVALDGWLARVSPLCGEAHRLATLRATELVKVPAMARLSPTQLRVALRWARGETAQEIAAALARGTETVRTHVREVYRRLAINSRLELVEHQTEWDSWGWLDD